MPENIPSSETHARLGELSTALQHEAGLSPEQIGHIFSLLAERGLDAVTLDGLLRGKSKEEIGGELQVNNKSETPSISLEEQKVSLFIEYIKRTEVAAGLTPDGYPDKIMVPGPDSRSIDLGEWKGTRFEGSRIEKDLRLLFDCMRLRSRLSSEVLVELRSELPKMEDGLVESTVGILGAMASDLEFLATEYPGVLSSLQKTYAQHNPENKTGRISSGLLDAADKVTEIAYKAQRIILRGIRDSARNAFTYLRIKDGEDQEKQLYAEMFITRLEAILTGLDGEVIIPKLHDKYEAGMMELMSRDSIQPEEGFGPGEVRKTLTTGARFGDVAERAFVEITPGT
jgi:hypothetical protein